jgi:hypothetical protein
LVIGHPDKQNPWDSFALLLADEIRDVAWTFWLRPEEFGRDRHRPLNPETT